jgi:flavin reductase (DIM6/NTAB) family NADH-FMN oxidoreductase RutF
MAIGAQQFRDALRFWASGVSVVTVQAPRGLASITVSSFASLSLDPPLVLICIERRVRVHRLIAQRRAFAVNILGAGQLALSERAAGRLGRAAARLGGVGTYTAVTGAPILEGTLAWLDCRLQARHPGGDHTIFVGRVEAVGIGGGRPLLWFDRGYHVPARKHRRP